VTIVAFFIDKFGINVIKHGPDIRVSRLSYSLNGEAPQAVSYEETVAVSPGDTIKLLDLWYHSAKDGDRFDKAAGEAYIKDPAGTFGDGGFTGGVSVTAGEHKVDDFYGKGTQDEWTLQAGMDRVVVALIHYRKCWHPEGCHEVDDRFYFNLRYHSP